MGELTFAPLANFAEITMGQSPASEACNTDNIGLPFLQGCGEFGRRNPETDSYCSPPLRIGKANATLISVRAPVGTMNYADKDYCIGRGLAAFKSKPGIANDIFLKHAVEQGLGFLHRRSQGSTFAAVSSSDIRSFPIPYFSVPKQNAIASILTSIDTAIEKTEALIAKYQQIKAGLMHDLFTRGMLPNGQLRPPREQAPELYQETALGWISTEWRIVSAGAISQSIVPGREKPFIDGGEIPWITVTDIDELYVTQSSTRLSISKQSLRAAGGRLVPKGTVVLSCVGDFGLAAVAGNELTMNQQLHGFIPSSQVLPEWLAHNIHRQRHYMERIATQTTIKYMNKAACESIPILVPRMDEQKMLCEKFSQISEVIWSLGVETKKLSQQKLGLMQDLLTGKVTVQADAPGMEAAA